MTYSDKLSPPQGKFNERTIYHEYMAVDPLTGRTHANPVQAFAISYLCKRWNETKSAVFMEDAIIYAESQNLPILPKLRREVAKAFISRRGKKTSKAAREGYKGMGLRIMANLVVLGISVSRAAEVAALTLLNNFGYRITASTLEKQYPKRYRNGSPSEEDLLKDYYKKSPNKDFDSQWLELERNAPPIPSDLKGERR